MKPSGYEQHSEDGTCYVARYKPMMMVHDVLTDEGWGVWWKGTLVDVKPTREAARELVRALKEDGLGDVAEVLAS